jgi:hypothetical protein
MLCIRLMLLQSVIKHATSVVDQVVPYGSSMILEVLSWRSKKEQIV